ncbi:MAG: SDR family NAD(P)-dependent oxidoreductase [Halobacteriales archaeon]|nr:SDR family NAD(P)-dependent oxidoreductase [Halobacteriales archaeon]
MSTDQFSVEGLRTVVTGSSRGIGRAIAEQFGADGADVVVCAPAGEHEQLEAVVSDIEAAGGRGLAVPCDVIDREAVVDLLSATEDTFGGVDVLINNVGGGRIEPFESVSPADWRAIMDLNLTGTVNCTQLLGEAIRGQGGSIINIASGAGLQGFPGESAYSAAKAAVIRLTETVAFEWAYDDVRVNCIAPGLISTSLSQEQPMPVPDPEDIDRDRVARRYGRPDEIADAAQYLASPAASFVTGRTLFVGGVPRLERHFEVARVGPDENAWVH